MHKPSGPPKMEIALLQAKEIKLAGKHKITFTKLVERHLESVRQEQPENEWFYGRN